MPRSFGAIRQLPSGRFQARFKRDGEWHNAPETFATEKAADAWLRHAGTDHDRGEFIDHRKGATCFGPYARGVLDALELTLRASTVDKVEGYWRRYIEPAFGEEPLAAIDAAAVRRWVVELSGERGLAPATVAYAGQLVSRMFDSAVAERLISANPTATVKWPARRDAEMRTVTVAEVDALAAAIDPDYRTLILTACHAGLRFGELAALTVGDINPLGRTVSVTKTVSESGGRLRKGPPKTAAGRRSVPIPAWLADELALHMAGRHRDDIMWPNPSGGYLRHSNFHSRYWSPAVEAIGRKGTLRIHDMRHTAVSLWIAAGVEAKRIAQWAGHKSVAMVLDRYGHLFAGDTDEAVARLDAYVAAKRAEVVAEAEKVVELRGRMGRPIGT